VLRETVAAQIADELVVGRVDLRLELLEAILKFVDLATSGSAGLLATVPIDEVRAEQAHQRAHPLRSIPDVFMT
jgi:hypothetical protein